MSERHTVDFDQISFNVISDAERETITLQFDATSGTYGREQTKRIIQAITGRFGPGIRSRASRWLTGLGDPLALVRRSGTHPENPDVLCLELSVKRGVCVESALAELVEFLRRQPGYRRLLGQPLDRDQVLPRVCEFAARDSAEAATDTLKRMMEHRRRRNERPTTP